MSETKIIEPNTFVDVLLPRLRCPECQGPVEISIEAWDPETGEPHEFAVQCANEGDDEPTAEDDEECQDCGGTGSLSGDENDDSGDCDLCAGYGVTYGHRYFQSDWQEIRDRSEAWARAQGFRVNTDKNPAKKARPSK